MSSDFSRVEHVNSSNDVQGSQSSSNQAAQALKQIGVSFLPQLDTDCSFKIFVITASDLSTLPVNWKQLCYGSPTVREPQLEFRSVLSNGSSVDTVMVFSMKA